MASTYINDLRLEEIADGEQSGTWGATTNTNLELIGDAFGFGTEAITTNANTHTSTIADGAADAARAMYLVYTGALDSTCTITIAPDTLSKVWFIKNATTDSGSSGPYSIIIKQGSGSGAAITIANGETKAVATNGTGSGAIVFDVFANLSFSAGGTLNINGTTDATSTTDGSLQTDGGLSVVKDAVIGNDLLLLSDASVIKFGANSEITLTHVHDSGLILGGTAPSLTIGDAGAEDAKIVFDGNAQDFHVGLDDSSDDLVIGLGSALGTTPAISIDENVLVTVADDVSVVGRAVSPTAPVENDGNIDLAVANNFKVTPGGAFDLTFANPAIGQSGNILFINSGGHAIGAEAKILVAPATLTAISAAGTYLVTYYCTATSGANTILVTSSAILT